VQTCIWDDMAQPMPLPLTISCFSKSRLVFAFLVPAHPGSTGKRAIKRTCVCVCVRACRARACARACVRACVRVCLDFTEARDSEWQWHKLGHMQVCTALQTDSHASTPALSFLQAGCPSCRPTNRVKALKVKVIQI